MALDIEQIAAVSYNAVLNDKRKPTGQWQDRTAMDAMEKAGILRREDLGNQIEFDLDYRRNPSAGFIAIEFTAQSLAKTEVITAALYDPAEFNEFVTWSKKDDAKTPTKNSKFSFTEALISNGLDTHDDVFEEAIFASATNGFTGLPGLFPTSGQGSVGGIDAGIEAWWRHPVDTYLADGSDIDAVLSGLWADASKGSGSKTKPTNLLSGSDPWTLYESQLSAQRVYDSQDYKGGAKTLMFKTAMWDFSQYGDDSVYGVSAKSVGLVVSKAYFRDKGATVPLTSNGVAGFAFPIYTAAQMGTGAKSRAFRASLA